MPEGVLDCAVVVVVVVSVAAEVVLAGPVAVVVGVVGVFDVLPVSVLPVDAAVELDSEVLGCDDEAEAVAGEVAVPDGREEPAVDAVELLPVSVLVSSAMQNSLNSENYRPYLLFYGQCYNNAYTTINLLGEFVLPTRIVKNNSDSILTKIYFHFITLPSIHIELLSLNETTVDCTLV